MNIAGLEPIEDPEYRYKMHRIIGKAPRRVREDARAAPGAPRARARGTPEKPQWQVEGRGNGIKTVIPNMTLVAQTLHRPPGEVTKFFGCELGAQTTWNDDTERSIVNGAHETKVLQDKLSIYIEKFVLCPSCKLPETSYKIKHEIIYHQCVACGAREAVDMQHKLCTFILKQHKLDKKAKDKSKDKKDKKKDKKDKKDDDDGDDEEKARKKAEKKAKKAAKENETDEEKAKRKAEKKAKKAAEKAAKEAGGGSDDDDDDDDDDDESGAMESAVKGIRDYIAGGKQPSEVVSELRAVQTFCALPRSERGFILAAAAFDDGLLEQIDGKADLLRAFVKDAGAPSLLGGLEKFALVSSPALAPKFALVLKQLYDSDVLEEDALVAWHDAGAAPPDAAIHVPDACDVESRAKLLAFAEPFITWLKEAEEDETDED